MKYDRSIDARDFGGAKGFFVCYQSDTTDSGSYRMKIVPAKPDADEVTDESQFASLISGSYEPIQNSDKVVFHRSNGEVWLIKSCFVHTPKLLVDDWE